MEMRSTTYALALLMALSLVGFASADPPVRDHEIEPDDYFAIGVITGCYPSPDGTYVAYTESRWDPIPGKRELDLWVVEVATKSVRRLTLDWASDSSPKWSPDGKYIYFGSARKRAGETDPPCNGKRQVWRVSPEGGPIMPVDPASPAESGCSTSPPMGTPSTTRPRRNT